MQGLSLANNLLANRVQYNLSRNQESLKNTVAQLSSGLRINSAADDPSGLAISTNLQTQVDAFQQASQNVQDANNAAQVAEGALAAQTGILQRIRSLAVEASSSINSTSDNANLQSEIAQLILEINRISQNTNFNGQALLDGSHAGFQPYAGASYSITSNAVLASGNGSASSGTGVVNGNMAGPALASNLFVPTTPTGWANTFGTSGMYNGNDGFLDLTLPAGQQAVVLSGAQVSQTITGLTPGATYQLSYAAGQAPGFGSAFSASAGSATSVPPLTNAWQTFAMPFTANASGQATITFAEKSPGFGRVDVTNVSIAAVSGPPSNANLVSGVTQVTTTAAGFITSSNAGAGGAGTIFNTTNSGAVDGTIELQVVNTGSTTVGVQVSFYTSASGAAGTQVVYASKAAANSLVSVDGLNITIGNVTAADAGTSAYIKVSQAVAASSSPSGPLTVQSGADEGNTVQIGIQATNAQTLRISNINVANTFAPVLAAEDALGQVQNALDTLLSQRAQLGAVIVRLNEDANNDNVASVNLQASESAIRDVNVGQATTAFTRLQVLVQVGTSVLAQSNSNAYSVLGLLH